ncbi:MAG: hypothetical protein DDG59_14655 [Anaerolineae bacterium]|jgi:DNA-binding transcriptional regulator LsrR (DeoR family)|nr:MAG: hypothetical protein DDG59_14655 [Anaerolineae bacterium]
MHLESFRPSQDQDSLVTVVAWLYYQEDLTHDQIAKRLGLSRVKVTRLLQKARKEGVIQFTITRPLPEEFELQKRLCELSHLKEAIIVQTRRSLEETMEAVGKASAEHLIRNLRNGLRLGMGWSTTVSRMAHYLKPVKKNLSFTVCDLAGTMLGQTNPYTISWLVAQLYNAKLETLPVPVLVESEDTRNVLFQEPRIVQAMNEAQKCDLAYVGLGHLEPDTTLVRVGLLPWEEIEKLKNKGAVGEILMRYYDENGENIPTPWEKQIISLGWDHIHKIPSLVVIAAGLHKVQAICGAIRGNLCRCLITDTETAKAIIVHLESTRNLSANR